MIFVISGLLLLPIVELVVMIQVGQWLGGFEMLALLVMCTFLGVWIVKHQGVGAWRRIRADLAVGRVPAARLIDGGLILAAGVMFIIPGFVTDLIAVLLLLPPVRALVRNALARRWQVSPVAVTTTTTTTMRGDALDVDSRPHTSNDRHELGP
ncbi:MAG: FxsA family protein [Acidimicrobiia bacterium]